MRKPTRLWRTWCDFRHWGKKRKRVEIELREKGKRLRGPTSSGGPFLSSSDG